MLRNCCTVGQNLRFGVLGDSMSAELHEWHQEARAWGRPKQKEHKHGLVKPDTGHVLPN